MVERMVSSNLGKYGIGKCASIISSTDSQHVPLVSVKDSIIIDAQNDNKNGLPNAPFENPALHKGEAATRPPSSSTANHNLVYARRKSDAELINSRTLDKNRMSEHVGDDKHIPETDNRMSEQVGDEKHIPETDVKSKGNSDSFMDDRIRNSENEQSAVVSTPVMEKWNTRFCQLQKYLKQCDSLNQEVYLRRLRSLSPDECSKHAIELEKRTIRLTVEEGREIQRVQDLNVLGKSAGNHLLLRPATHVFKSENLV